ncbi:MAG: hypothetical protein M0R80_04775 [Proteobacteria bacterium]|jgi:hypothetical protein|nr:hypothetical protein [Pseudomonadota bacterium]
MGAQRTIRPRAVAICFLLPLLGAAAAIADETPAKRPFALLVPPAQKELADSLVVAAGSGLLDLDVELFMVDVEAALRPPPDGAVEARAIARNAGAFAAIWIDPAEGGTVCAVAAGTAAGEAFVRRVGEPDPDAQVEAMAVIIRTAVEQILAAAREPATPATPVIPAPEAPPTGSRSPPAAPARAPPDARRQEPVPGDRDFGLLQETEYAMHVASKQLGVSHGVNLRLGATVPYGLAAYAGYTALSPVAVRGALGDLELTRHPFHVGFKAHVGEGLVRGFGEANLVVDYLVPRLSSLAPDLRATDTEPSILVSALAVVGIGLHVLAPVTIYAAAGAEIPFNRTAYVIGSGDRVERVAAPWPVQPWVLAGLMLDVL